MSGRRERWNGIEHRMSAVVAPPATGILDPRTGLPVGADDPSFVRLNEELADKGFLITAAEDLITWARTGSLMWMTFGLGFAILGTVFLLYRPFLVISFDPVLAATLRLPAELLRNIMLILLAVTVVVSLQTVGIGLVAAMLVTPAATAYLLARRLAPMMFMSAAIGAFSSLVGLYISYYLNIVSGSAIVLTATAVFLVVFLLKRGRR